MSLGNYAGVSVSVRGFHKNVTSVLTEYVQRSQHEHVEELTTERIVQEKTSPIRKYYDSYLRHIKKGQAAFQ